MRKGTVKKISLILIAVIVITMLPSAVFAENISDQVTEIEDVENITENFETEEVDKDPEGDDFPQTEDPMSEEESVIDLATLEGPNPEENDFNGDEEIIFYVWELLSDEELASWILDADNDEHLKEIYSTDNDEKFALDMRIASLSDDLFLLVNEKINSLLNENDNSAVEVEKIEEESDEEEPAEEQPVEEPIKEEPVKEEPAEKPAKEEPVIEEAAIEEMKEEPDLTEMMLPVFAMQSVPQQTTSTYNYPWYDLSDDDFSSWVLKEENKSYIKDLLGKENDEHALFIDRINQTPDQTQAVLYTHLDSITNETAGGGDEQISSDEISQSFSSDGLTFTVTYPKTISCGQSIRFKFSASGGSGTYQYRIHSIFDQENVTVYDVSWPGHSNYKTDAYFDFTFYASGTYYMRFSAMDCGVTPRKTINTSYHGIQLNINDPNYPSVDSIVADIAQMCLANCTTDYEKTLWLHDYLIDLTEYDHSFSYCSAEATLARKSGTCEGYHRAFVKLLNAVGVNAGRIEGNGHVWTAVKIDGEWYQIDTTWDDTVDSFGVGRHLQMCLNDTIMTLVHDKHSPNAGYESNNLKYNWLMKTGKIKEWSDVFNDEIQSNINLKKTSFTINVSSTMPPDYRNVIYSVAAYDYMQRNWGENISLSCSYTDDGDYSNSGKLSFTVSYTTPSPSPSPTPTPTPTPSPSPTPTPTPTPTHSPVPVSTEGKCGDNLNWRIDKNGLLTISGSGTMYDYSDPQGSNPAPWKAHISNIQSLAISDGTTRIGNNAFSLCSSLKNISFSGDAPAFGTNCFKSVNATATVQYSKKNWTDSVMQSYGGNITWNVIGQNKIDLENTSITGGQTVYVDGIAYSVDSRNDVILPDNVEAKTVTSYGYNSNSGDVHTSYPTSVSVYELTKSGDSYVATKLDEFDNCLQYKGSSIRITGVKGIRMITGVPDSLKTALQSGTLSGYTLEEYGTLLAWSSNISDSTPLVLGQPYVKSNYAYKKGVSDPVFKQTDGITQYTNVITFGNDLSKCVEDLAMRPYMILSKNGQQRVIYGGILYRNIGYVAYQNRNAFPKGTEAYNFIWDIINYVYPNGYKAK